MIVERAVPLGGNVTIDGVDITDELALKSELIGKTNILTAPYFVHYGALMYVRGKIYAICNDESSKKYNYCYVHDGESWTQLSDSPSNKEYTSYVAYKGEIHAFQDSHHYKYDGESWIELSNPPFNATYTSAVIYNDEIHLIDRTYGGTNRDYHYKWDGTTWTQASLLPVDRSGKSFGIATVYNGSLYYMYGNKAYRYENGTWSDAISRMVQNAYCTRCACEYQGKLYVGNDYNSSSTWGMYSVFDGTSLSESNYIDSGRLTAMLKVDDELWFCEQTIIQSQDKKIYYKGWYEEYDNN